MTDGQVAARAEALSAALEKLPPYVGPVWRQCPLDPRCAREYRVGDVLIELAFLSTTRDPAVHMPGDLTYVLACRTGKDISAIAGEQLDGEVVFNRSSLLLVLSVDFSGAEAVVYMAEVPDQPRDEDLVPDSRDNLLVLTQLRAAQADRMAVQATVRRTVSLPDKYAFPVGMSDERVPRLAVARQQRRG